MKKLLCTIVIVLLMIICVNKVNAAKVSGGQVNLFGSNIDISHFKPYSINDVSQIQEVCAYIDSSKNGDSSSDNHSRDINNNYASPDLKYLFIYSDGTASVGWSGTGCNRMVSNSGTSDGCVDGQDKNGEKIAGIKNWSKNKSGVEKNLKSIFDAYESFSSSNICPMYIAQGENFGANWFYISTGDRIKDYNNIVSKTKNLKGNNKYYYYNIGENLNLDETLLCLYSEDSNDDVDNSAFVIGIASNGYTVIKSARQVLNVNNEEVKGYSINTNARFTSKAYLRMIEQGKCPKSVDACITKPNLPFLTYSNQTFNNITVFGDTSITKNFCSGGMSFTFSCVGDNCSDDSICQAYDEYLVDMGKNLNSYMSSKKSTELNNYNNTKDELNSFCASALSQLNYNEGNCVESCINMNKDIAQLETDNKFRSNELNQKCGIGTSIISMIYNILKWIKYIPPALIIILTMLDFIKAIAAQNDDDMKKAQGKFIKRLIVAALLFLLPLIINFVLQTFGFYNSGCDITDLL